MKLSENGSGFYNSDKCKNWSMEDEKNPGVSLISKADREDEGGSSGSGSDGTFGGKRYGIK